jgi:hypothetical protein
VRRQGFARFHEGGAEVGAEQRLRIAIGPVEIEELRVDVAREVRQDERRVGEADEADPIDRLRLVLEKVLNLENGPREPR